MRPRLAIAAAIAGALVAGAAQAQKPRVQVDCLAWANFGASIAEFREVGAPLPGILSYIGRRHPAGLLRTALEREARRVYGQGRAPEDARADAYRRCQDYLGEIPVEG